MNSKKGDNAIGRRKFLGSMAALSMAGLSSSSFTTRQRAPVKIKETDSVIFRKGYILSMDPETGSLPEADLYVRGKQIAAIGQNLSVAEGTQEVNAKNHFILPGFVDTHWHLWNSLMRSLIGSKPGVGYFAMKQKIGPHYRPQDTYAATRFAVAEAISAGFTSLHDWSHNVRNPAHAEASLKALQELGIRARYSQGMAEGQGPAVDLDLLQQLHDNWASYDPSGKLALGLAWEGLEGDKAQRLKEVGTARRLGLPISLHANTLEGLQDILANDFQLIHCMQMDEAAFRQLAEMGVSVSSSPYSEMRIGFGLPPVLAMLGSGVKIGLSVDTTPLSGNANMFEIMKVMLNLACGLSQNEFKVSAQRILEMATREGAESLGLGNITGSLKPGKRADLQLIALEEPNLGVLTDPEHLLVQSAQPRNIQAVMIDGQFRKLSGQLVDVNTAEIIQDAQDSLAWLLEESGY